MLGKLIKYNWKNYWKLAVVLHGFLLLSSVIIRLMFMDRIDTSSAPTDLTIFVIAALFIIYSMVFTALSYYAALVPSVRFYRQLYSDRGHLTWMLPVSARTHLWSHIISGALLYLASMACMALSLIILISGRNLRQFWIIFFEELDTSPHEMIVSLLPFTVIISVVGAVCVVIQMYFCICVGQLFSSHKVLGAVITYIAVTFVIQIIVLISLFIVDGPYPFYEWAETGMQTSFFISIKDISIFSLILMIITAIPQYIACDYMMRKNLNL